MPWSRKKSCERCRSAKARCNQATPACSRCSERQLKCIYDRWDTNRAAVHPYSPGTTSFIDTQPEASPWTGPFQLGSGSDQGLFADRHLNIAAGEALPDFEEQLQLGWSTTSTLSGADLAAQEAFEGQGLGPQPQIITQQDDSVPGRLLSITSEAVTSWNQNLPQSLNNVLLSTPTTSQVAVVIEQSKDHRMLMRRGAHKSCPLTSIIMGQIVSYPEMMIAGDQLPPFIQAPCHVDEELAQDCAESGKHRCLPKELAICSSLVQMFYQRTMANASFGWKLIYEEVERLHTEVRECHLSLYMLRILWNKLNNASVP